MIEYLVSRKSTAVVGAAMFLALLIAASPTVATVTRNNAPWAPAVDGRQLAVADLVAYGMDIEPSGMVPCAAPETGYGMDIEPSGVLPAAV